MSIYNTNISIFRSINDSGKDSEIISSLFVFFAEYTVYFLILSVLLFWFIGKRDSRIMVISAGVAFILAEILGKVAGKLHNNLQPFAVLDDVNQLVERSINNSFPSDHTILFFTFCITFALFMKRYAPIWVITALLVGTSRVGVGVHYPFDVLVGAFIACLTAVLCYCFIPRLKLVKSSLDFYERVESKLLMKSKKNA